MLYEVITDDLFARGMRFTFAGWREKMRLVVLRDAIACSVEYIRRVVEQSALSGQHAARDEIDTGGWPRTRRCRI